jgi:hypothetical protein
LGRCKTALLSQEGSVIAQQSREGWFQSAFLQDSLSGTTPVHCEADHPRRADSWSSMTTFDRRGGPSFRRGIWLGCCFLALPQYG